MNLLSLLASSSDPRLQAGPWWGTLANSCAKAIHSMWSLFSSLHQSEDKMHPGPSSKQWCLCLAVPWTLKHLPKVPGAWWGGRGALVTALRSASCPAVARARIPILGPIWCLFQSLPLYCCSHVLIAHSSQWRGDQGFAQGKRPAEKSYVGSYLVGSLCFPPFLGVLRQPGVSARGTIFSLPLGTMGSWAECWLGQKTWGCLKYVHSQKECKPHNKLTTSNREKQFSPLKRCWKDTWGDIPTVSLANCLFDLEWVICRRSGLCEVFQTYRWRTGEKFLPLNTFLSSDNFFLIEVKFTQHKTNCFKV